MGGAKELRAETQLIRAGAESATVAGTHFVDTPDALAGTAGGVDAAVPGSRTTGVWQRTGRHCVAYLEAEIVELRAFTRGLVDTATLIETTDRDLAGLVPRNRAGP